MLYDYWISSQELLEYIYIILAVGVDILPRRLGKNN